MTDESMKRIVSKAPSSMVKRDLDGIYLRVEIAGKWQNRCLTDLMWDDVKAWIVEKGVQIEEPLDYAAFLVQVVQHLHYHLRAVGDQFDIKGAE